MKYGFIYETTCLVTGMKYIGSHKRSQNPEDPDDSWYLGSGIYFSNALNHYGKDNFVRIILAEANNEEELIQKEEYYLNLYDCANNSVYYNIINSGYRRGIEGFVMPEDAREKISLAHRGKHFTESHKLNLSRSLKSRVKSPESIKKMAESLRGRKLPDEVKLQISHSLKERNPMSNPESRKKVAESKLGKIWVHKGEIQTYVSLEDLDSYLSNGYSKGMLKRRGSTSKDYACHCKVCGKDYKGGKYSTMCKECYSEMKGAQLALSRGGNK